MSFAIIQMLIFRQKQNVRPIHIPETVRASQKKFETIFHRNIPQRRNLTHTKTKPPIRPARLITDNEKPDSRTSRCTASVAFTSPGHLGRD